VGIDDLAHDDLPRLVEFKSDMPAAFEGGRCFQYPGGGTFLPGIAVSPASFNSSVPRGYFAPQACIASAIAKETMLT